MPFIFAGYFPKKIERPPAGLDLRGGSEIWSVSNCISKGPEDWIGLWRHNDLWLFDTPAIARSVVSPDKSDAFHLVAYGILSECFDNGKTRSASLAEVGARPPEAGLELLGYDVVTGSEGVDFGHSPLSCNSGAKSFEVNQYCLFLKPEDAIRAAPVFASGPWEPGPYYVVEVSRVLNEVRREGCT
jgi:hypothetical protein